ncbi:uncharacterized protein LOC143844190 [Paroedura picta]|uniref:uncharacterized protein LOC143844190 n=1 Tax=Paroedura picta TaxID=143630 RepID=UPI0040566768
MATTTNWLMWEMEPKPNWLPQEAEPDRKCQPVRSCISAGGLPRTLTHAELQGVQSSKNTSRRRFRPGQNDIQYSISPQSRRYGRANGTEANGALFLVVWTEW